MNHLYPTKIGFGFDSNDNTKIDAERKLHLRAAGMEEDEEEEEAARDDDPSSAGMLCSIFFYYLLISNFTTI